jgi:hypothetical protein
MIYDRKSLLCDIQVDNKTGAINDLTKIIHTTAGTQPGIF